MTGLPLRRGWGPFAGGWYRSTDGRFGILVIGWNPTSGSRAYRSDGRPYGYTLFEGDVERGRYVHLDSAVAEAKKLREEAEKS